MASHDTERIAAELERQGIALSNIGGRVQRPSRIEAPLADFAQAVYRVLSKVVDTNIEKPKRLR